MTSCIAVRIDQMGGWNSRAGVLDLEARRGQVNDRPNQHHAAGAAAVQLRWQKSLAGDP